MSESLLNVLKLLLLALVYLFFIRVLRMMWLQVTAPAPATPANDPTIRGSSSASGGATARLRVVEGADTKGKTFDLGDEVTVGRASGCQVLLTDPAVSQLHARIYRRDGKLYIEDLGSSNGTYVNRKKVSSAVAIRRGDRIVLGGTVLEVAR